MVAAVFHDKGFKAGEAFLVVIVATRHGLRTDLDGLDPRGVPRYQRFRAFGDLAGAFDQFP